jgi:hypothetical protein
LFDLFSKYIDIIFKNFNFGEEEIDIFLYFAVFIDDFNSVNFLDSKLSFLFGEGLEVVEGGLFDHNFLETEEDLSVLLLFVSKLIDIFFGLLFIEILSFSL